MHPLLLRFGLIVFVAAVLVTSQFLMKLGTRGDPLVLASAADLLGLIQRVLTTPLLLLGYGLSGMASLVWLVVLSRTELSLAAPILNGVFFMLLLLASPAVLGESISLSRWLGTLLILAGMIVLSQDAPGGASLL